MYSEVLELSDEERTTLFRAKREQEEQAQRESRAQAAQMEGRGQQDLAQQEDQVQLDLAQPEEQSHQEQGRGRIVALDAVDGAALPGPNDASLLTQPPTAGASGLEMPATLEAQQDTGLGLVQVARIDTPA